MRRLVASCSIAVVAVAVLAACGGSGSKRPASSDGKQPGTSEKKGDASGRAFAKLYADAANRKFKITFTIGGKDEKTYAQDGNGKSVYAAGDSQTFTSSAGSVVCTRASGTATCAPLPGSDTTSPFAGYYTAGKKYIEALGGNVGDESSKTIAGRAAQCATISAQSVARAAGAGVRPIKGSATYCIDKDTGVLLEIGSTDASGDESTAFAVTKFEQPTDSELTPPATP
ncbi:MAG: hypothetical protein QOG50_207 [Actinomycetota bacterium]|nr:hypothetical protein [Actinomycetota bacterium]